ncbi:30S ribosomal protein S20 [Chondromyces crocatus]|uniref:Small ribosomal subunit protein bS20 n=1 Tax=Chondromyces crocatus TaxID=52 RepID=A0A0K1E5T9_CHOCO|nr:30S ribosomal protein S20 [Chondromyces crocatus]AKT36240.1 30S ribosomal protein S20 [Chondromyces crocatus]
MATHASAEKRNRQRIKRTARNRAAKSELRTTLKKARNSVKTSAQDASTATVTAQSQLDRAASRGVIPKERASRLKARLAKSLHKATAKLAAAS